MELSLPLNQRVELPLPLPMPLLLPMALPLPCCGATVVAEPESRAVAPSAVAVPSGAAAADVAAVEEYEGLKSIRKNKRRE